MAQHFLLEAPSLEEARAKALREHGPSARIVKAERLYDRGLAALLVDADAADTVVVPGLGPVHLSTGEARFEDVLRSLTETAPGAAGAGEGESCSS